MIYFEQRNVVTMEEGFDIAQICQNGHVTNSSVRFYPQFNQKFCQTCGTATITSCSGCSAPIRGTYLDGLGARYAAPGFCSYCGDPFPWTQARVNAAFELVQELDMLDEQDKALLQKSIDDLIKNTPATLIATRRFKKIMAKAGPDTASIFRDILIDVTPESIWSS